jgi:hypothetical protein
MIYCLANIIRLKRWEIRPAQKVFSYSVKLNPKTKLWDARFSIATTLAQLQGLDKKFVFTVYGGNGEILYTHKN